MKKFLWICLSLASCPHFNERIAGRVLLWKKIVAAQDMGGGREMSGNNFDEQITVLSFRSLISLGALRETARCAWGSSRSWAFRRLL